MKERGRENDDYAAVQEGHEQGIRAHKKMTKLTKGDKVKWKGKVEERESVRDKEKGKKDTRGSEDDSKRRVRRGVRGKREGERVR